MKNFNIILLSMALFLVSLTNICYANYYDEHPERYLKRTHQATGDLYFDKNSLSVTTYNPPIYILEVNTVMNTNDRNKDALLLKTTFIYDVSKASIIATITSAANDRNGIQTKPWRLINPPTTTLLDTSKNMFADANKLFAVPYKEEFYYFVIDYAIKYPDKTLIDLEQILN